MTQIPFSREIEKDLVGTMLLHPEKVDEVFSLVEADVFYVDKFRILAEAIASLRANFAPIEETFVSEHLSKKKQLEQIGGKVEIQDIIFETPHGVDIEAYCKELQALWLRRQYIRGLNEAIAKAYDLSVPVEEVTDCAESAVFDLGESLSESKLEKVGDIATDVVVELDNTVKEGDITGLPTGFYENDLKTGGFQRSDLVVVAARPSMGKTAFAMQAAAYMAWHSKQPVAVFSLEMDKKSLAKRLIACEAGVDLTQLRNGHLTSEDWGRIIPAIKKLNETPLLIDDGFGASASSVQSKCMKLASQYGTIGGIVIDYLQLMEMKGDNENHEISKIMRSLKMIARKLDCPVILLSQLNRGVESRSNKRPVMSDLRASGAIEQDADVITMLYRDEYYNSNTTDKGIAEVIMAKNRNGSTGTMRLLFEGQYSRFRNIYSPDAKVPEYPPPAPEPKEIQPRQIDMAAVEAEIEKLANSLEDF